MCVVSMVMDHYGDKWRPLVPQYPYPGVYPYWPQQPAVPQTPEDLQRELAKFHKLVTPPAPAQKPLVSDEEIAEFRRLLDRARDYDKRNSEPDCELAEKRDALKVIAKALGVDISFVDAPPEASV